MAEETIERRVDELEKHRERVEARLDGGAKAFDAVRKEIDKLVERTNPKAIPIWQILGVVLATLTTVFGVWWQARGEIDSKASAADVSAVQREVNEQRVVLTSVKSTAENTAQQLGEMKADVKSDLSELKIDIRALSARGK
jgi:predicted  nucleic acid-binding Zn-ribbon protein